MNEEFCSCCGKLGFGPMVQEDHDDFFCYSCVLINPYRLPGLVTAGAA